MAGRQVVVAESVATRCTKEALGRGKHIRPKYDITEGLGSESEVVICTECAKEREERPAITAYRRKMTLAGKPGAAVDQPVATARPVKPSGFDWREKHWGWLVLVAGLLLLSIPLWGGAAIFAVWALIFFLFVRPMRCHNLTRGTAEQCRFWARGLLRACDNEEHKENRHDGLRDLVLDRRWPDFWDTRPAKDALVGTAVATVLLLVAGSGYLLTKVF